MKKIIIPLLPLIFLASCSQSPDAPFTGAQWIGKTIADTAFYDEEGHSQVPALCLNNEFLLEKPVKNARLYISAMGWYEVFINGERVGDDVFGNLPTEYDHTIYYLSYDVTSLLEEGGNTIGIMLTPGYAVGMQKGMALFGAPRVIADLQIQTGWNKWQRILTDTTWIMTDKGPVTRSDLYDGETYDARLDFTPYYEQAQVLPAPGGKLLPQPAPSMAVMDTIAPLSVKPVIKTENKKTIETGHWLVDMGQNMVGWFSLTAKGKEGQPVIMRFAETLQADSMTIYTDNLRDARCTNTYIPAEDGEFTYCPSTVYQGFRYVDIEGLEEAPSLSDMKGLVIYDRMTSTSSFECSNDILNRLHRAAYNGIRGNYHGMPTDCPQRDERLGWLGDRFTGAYGESYLFDNHEFYLKWLQDIEDTQDSLGQVAHIAPQYWLRLRSANVTWCGTYISIAYMLLQRYGDEQGFRLHYDSMRRWVQFIVNNAMEDGLVVKDTYGDWCMPPESQELIHSKDPSRITEKAVLSTTVFYQLLGYMQEFARRMGKTADQQEYAALAESLRQAYNARYFNPETAQYSNNTVTANILSLALGLVPEGQEQRVMDNIVDVTVNRFDSHVSVGVLGIQHLMRTLTRMGHPELAYRIATNTSYPSWGYMLEHGATTIWELWNGDTANPAMNSGNHVMLLGDVLLWMYEDLAGIRPACDALPDAPDAYRQLYMQPYFAPGLDYVKASYQSPNGLIVSEWKRQEGNIIHWSVTLPKGVSAIVQLPNQTQQTFNESFVCTIDQ
ncbi:MAG: glycoside hydrolase family 78 protein [Paludibacteraceae bacterium]|nr:glycoside hydrolase family 78 protein [Paludibacteraceae bacterium]